MGHRGRGQSVVTRVTDVRCPRCDEDILVERIITGKTWVYLCLVCATSFPAVPFRTPAA